MFSLFIISVYLKRNILTKSSIRKVYSFGFKEHGSLSISVLSKNRFHNSKIILTNYSSISPNDFSNSTSEKFVFCENIEPDIVNNFSSFIENEGIYYLYLYSGNSTLAEYSIEGEFKNFNSVLDSRSYNYYKGFKSLALTYLILFAFWFSHHPIHRIFSHPLHLAFFLMSLFKAVVLYFYSQYWYYLQTNEKSNNFLLFLTNTLDIVYYTTNISCLIFVSSGYDTYRKGSSKKDLAKIVVPTLCLTSSYICIQYTKSDLSLILMLMVLFTSLFYCLNVFIVSQVAVFHAVKKLNSMPFLIKGVKRAQKFVKVMLSELMLVLLVYSFVYMFSENRTLCSLIYEYLTFKWTVQHMKYYLINYSRVKVYRQKTFLNCKPCIISNEITKESELVMLC